MLFFLLNHKKNWFKHLRILYFVIIKKCHHIQLCIEENIQNLEKKKKSLIMNEKKPDIIMTLNIYRESKTKSIKPILPDEGNKSKLFYFRNLIFFFPYHSQKKRYEDLTMWIFTEKILMLNHTGEKMYPEKFNHIHITILNNRSCKKI